ncbi:MAG: hypothetical protein AAF771_07730 [Pseudomonadota bacterium]
MAVMGAVRTVLWFVAGVAFLQAAALYVRMVHGLIGGVRGVLDPEHMQDQVVFYTVAAALAAFCGIMGLVIGVLALRRRITR